MSSLSSFYLVKNRKRKTTQQFTFKVQNKTLKKIQKINQIENQLQTESSANNLMVNFKPKVIIMKNYNYATGSLFINCKSKDQSHKKELVSNNVSSDDDQSIGLLEMSLLIKIFDESFAMTSLESGINNFFFDE